MPNLENLKKQAKQYLRWHRERYYPVAAHIRAALPRFHHLDDNQILESSFKLMDAQELVARQLGFVGWQALKSGAHGMTPQSKQTAPRPILSSTSAQLFVSDVKASCGFFADKLGFAIDFVYGDPPFYGQVIRDKAQLALRLVCGPVFVDDIRQREHLLSASITVDTASEIKRLFLAFQAAGVDFHQTLKKEPWGARNFIVLDPDGNLILFAVRPTEHILEILGTAWIVAKLRLLQCRKNRSNISSEIRDYRDRAAVRVLTPTPDTLPSHSRR